MAGPEDDAWASFSKDFKVFSNGVTNYKAVNINAERLRSDGRTLVQRYFREVRPDLEGLGMPPETLAALDTPLQAVMTLAAGQNSKASYLAHLRPLRKLLPKVDTEREYLVGKTSTPRRRVLGTKFEIDLHSTLEQLVPTAANSYLQALQDLSDAGRLSFRGPAADLREAVREVLDHLAPDDAVKKAPGFTPEKGRTEPTMKQKARFILKARRTPEGARSSTETATERVEEATAAMARSVYDRGSLSAHVTTTRNEVTQLKRYVETVLGDLLQVR